MKYDKSITSRVVLAVLLISSLLLNIILYIDNKEKEDAFNLSQDFLEYWYSEYEELYERYFNNLVEH